MPKGDNLKQLWSNPEWRAQRIKDLRENQEWIDRRAADLGKTNLAKAIKGRKTKAGQVNYSLVKANAVLWWELDKARRENQRMMQDLQKLYIVGGQDRRRSAETKSVSDRTVATNLTDEEHTLFRMACLSLGMTNREFIREALMFYAMWAVDRANMAQEPSEIVRERIGLRADIEEDIEVWRAFKMAAE